jgi:hypothetical protein
MSKITIKFWDATSDTDASAPDSVKHPSHYDYMDIQVIDLIHDNLTPEEFKGHCKACSLKYRCRAGKKGDALVDIAKARGNPDVRRTDADRAVRA